MEEEPHRDLNPGKAATLALLPRCVRVDRGALLPMQLRKKQGSRMQQPCRALSLSATQFERMQRIAPPTRRMWFWIKNRSLAELQASISSEMWCPDWPGLARGGRTACVFVGVLKGLRFNGDILPLL